MADIKMEEGFRTELNQLKSTAGKLNQQSLSGSGVASLPACEAFAQAIEEISGLIASYKQLVIKDANELLDFADEMQKLDNA